MMYLVQVPPMPAGMEKAISDAGSYGIPPFLLWFVVVLFCGMAAAIIGLFRALQQGRDQTIKLLLETQAQVQEQIRVISAIPELIKRHADESHVFRGEHEKVMRAIADDVRDMIRSNRERS